MDDSGSTISIEFSSCIFIKAAAFHSKCNVKYLCRLLRDGRLLGMKLGQTWLIDKSIFEAYLEKVHQSSDKRFGPKQFSPFGRVNNWFGSCEVSCRIKHAPDLFVGRLTRRYRVLRQKRRSRQPTA